CRSVGRRTVAASGRTLPRARRGGTERVCLEGSRRTPSEYCGRHRHRAFLPHEGRSAGRERVQGADERMTLECERTCGQTSPFSPAVGTEARLSTGRTR